MKINLKFLVLIFLIAISAGLFYWYEYRPSSIKKICNTRSIKSAQDFVKNSNYGYEYNLNSEDIKNGVYLPIHYENYYKSCLRENGL